MPFSFGWSYIRPRQQPYIAQRQSSQPRPDEAGNIEAEGLVFLAPPAGGGRTDLRHRVSRCWEIEPAVNQEVEG